MKATHSSLFILSLFLFSLCSSAQDSMHACTVNVPGINAQYKGDCKDGLAHGKGEASGYQRYTGSFKKGYPDGKGTFYYNDSLYYAGGFQMGLKEGKGEMHYVHAPQPDSVVKGYWSGDVFRGNEYVTYKFISGRFDSYEVNVTPDTEFTVTIDVGSTMGSPNGSVIHSLTGAQPAAILLRELVALNGDFIRIKSSTKDSRSSSTTYTLGKFPAKLAGSLTDGRTFEIELYRAGRWRIKLFINQ